MVTKPSVTTEWAVQLDSSGPSGNLNKIEPEAQFKDFGQPESGPVDRQSLNYQLNALHQWKDWSEQSVDILESSINGIPDWLITTTNTQLSARKNYFVDFTGSSIDLTLPLSFVAGETITIYNSHSSVTSCRIVNNGYTLKGVNFDLLSTDNILLDPKFIITFISKNSSTINFYIREVL